MAVDAALRRHLLGEVQTCAGHSKHGAGCNCERTVNSIIHRLEHEGYRVVETDLLHHLDGQLGLAVYRHEGDRVEWKQEASDLISAIRRVVKATDV